MNTTNQELITALTACVSRLKWHEQQLSSFPLDKVARERGEAALLAAKPCEKTMAPPPPKTFTVVTVSTNTNSFGYKSVLCLAEDGEGFEGLVQAYGCDPVPVRGDKVRKDDPRWYCGARALAPMLPKNAKKLLKSI